MSKSQDEPSVRFERLTIRRSHLGGLRGEIVFSGKDSKLEITLPEDALDGIVFHVGDQLAEASSIKIEELRDAFRVAVES